MEHELTIVEAAIELEQGKVSTDFVFDYEWTINIPHLVRLHCFHKDGLVYKVDLDLRSQNVMTDAQLLLQRLHHAVRRALLEANRKRMIEAGTGGALARKTARG